MRYWVVVLIFLTHFVSPINAQVQELWRTNFAVGSRGYPQAAIDPAGNTIVAGKVSTLIDEFTMPALVASFDKQGNKQWEFITPVTLTGDLDALSTDPQGNILFTAPTQSPTGEHGSFLVKLSPAGNQLWRAFIEGVGDEPHPTAIKIDASGNIFLTAALLHEPTPRNFISERLVAKFTPNGKLLWRTMLPGAGYLKDGELGLLRSLALTDSGDVVTCGTVISPPSSPSQPFTAFVTKLDASGRIVWWTTDSKAAKPPISYSSVAVGNKNTICASTYGGSTDVFSANGKPLQACEPSGLNAGGTVLGVATDGSFLLKQLGWFYTIKSTGGKARWGIQPSGIVWDVVTGDSDDWLAAGTGVSDDVEFSHINDKGIKLWQANLRGNPFKDFYGITEHVSVLKANDGTLRLIGSDRTGILILAVATNLD